MKERFWFNEEEYDFWPLYETIKKYYPLEAICTAEEVDYKDESPEALLRHNTIYESVYTRSHYSKKWGEFEKYLKKEVSKKIRTSHYLPYPCFGGSLLLEQKGGKGYQWTKEIHFSICLLGPFYTIYGLDTSEVVLERERIFGEEEGIKWQSFSRTQAITVSPYFEYKEAFLLLKQKIADWFKGHRFVPHRVSLMKIDGLEVEVSQKNESLRGTVHSALFDTWMEIDAPTRGDDTYGYQEWRKVVKPTEEDSKHLHRLEASKLKCKAQTGLTDDVSLHKLWQFKELTRLPRVSEASLSFPTFSLLDFTDPELLLLTTDKSEIPLATKYKVVDNEIILTSVSYFKFKVSLLSARELRLRVHLDVEAGEKNITGDLAELLYEPY